MRRSVVVGMLAILWAALLGDLSPYTLLAGVALGWFVAVICRSGQKTTSWPQPGRIIALGLFFVWELLLSNLRVARYVFTANARLRPAIVSVQVSMQLGGDLTALANLISLTPGTLVIDTADDGDALWVHSMHLVPRFSDFDR